MPEETLFNISRDIYIKEDSAELPANLHYIKNSKTSMNSPNLQPESSLPDFRDFTRNINPLSE
jgi:hypothetical protein